MQRVLVVLVFGLVFIFCQTFSQQKTILIPKQVAGAPFSFEDREDHFGQAYRFFIEGEPGLAVDQLKNVIARAGVTIRPDAYYVVLTQFTDSLNPIGVIHGSDDFLTTRMYGLDSNNLYYVFISRERGAPSWLSTLAIEKPSPFSENLPAFLGLFLPLVQPMAMALPSVETTWVDVRQYFIPELYRDNCDLSFLVKKKLSDEGVLARIVFDNTAREHWSFGIATAITSIDDVDIIVGEDGKIIVIPKPNLDLATFAVVNYHFSAVDTKQKTFGTSIHALGGIRLAGQLEVMLGIGGGVSLGIIDLHVFAGYSVEFANQLKPGFAIGQQLNSSTDPFGTKIRGKPRFGLEVKFP